MNYRYLTFIALFLLMACSKNANKPTPSSGSVLMLKVDYTTNTFEGGKEFSFAKSSPTFTIKNEYVSPGDFGSVKLIYNELNELLFDGTIIWMGTGKIIFPQNIQSAAQFTRVQTNDTVYPTNGLENVFNPYNESYNYTNMWLAIQSSAKVRDYLTANPSVTVKVFLYTPSVGVGNPAEWDWIIFLNK